MKKSLFALAAITVALVSCVTETSVDDQGLNSETLAFFPKTIDTKAGDAGIVSEPTGVTISLGSDGNGNMLFLEESISSMDELFYDAPETKGTPIYDRNFTSMRNSVNVVVYDAAGADANLGDTEFSLYDADSRIWSHDYPAGKDPWADNDSEVRHFFVRSAPGATVAADGYSVPVDGTGDLSMTFSYTSPTTVSEQEDIMFGATSLSKSDYVRNGYRRTGAPVTLHHALTAVKFRIGNDNSGNTKTLIKSVTLSGFANSGTCTIDLSAGTSSTTEASRCMWGYGSGTGSFTATYGTTIPDGKIDNGIDFSQNDGSNLGNSFYSSANTRNLNAADASLTFLLIPQTIPSTARMTITLIIKTDNYTSQEITQTVDLSKALSGVTWGAGQLRTYTLKPVVVGVEIMDDLTSTVKSNLVITNTGNVHEYVRMLLVGNWCNGEGNIVRGYTSAAGTTMVDLWTPGNTTYGTFDDSFPAGVPASGSKWTKGADGYYYYTEAIGPGEETGSHTAPLFNTYTVGTVPTIYLPSLSSSELTQAQGVHLVFDVIIQAIEAPYNADTKQFTKTWKQAWQSENVLGTGHNI